MGENPRAAKVADRIKEIIAKRLERGIRDPRLGFVTITDVRVTGDLQQRHDVAVGRRARDEVAGHDGTSFESDVLWEYSSP